jgi:hypothetical protein
MLLNLNYHIQDALPTDPVLNCWTPCLSVMIPEQGERHAKEKLYQRV